MILKYKCVEVLTGADWARVDFEVENDGSVVAWKGDVLMAKMMVPITNPELFDHFVEGTTYLVEILPVPAPVAASEPEQPTQQEQQEREQGEHLDHLPGLATDELKSSLGSAHDVDGPHPPE